MKINILGTEYDFAETTAEEDNRLYSNDGYLDGYYDIWEKTIRVVSDIENHPNNSGNLDEYKAKVKRHEIVHAFLGESCLKDYNDDEVIVDWIAFQFPKMLKAFQEVGCI